MSAVLPRSSQHDRPDSSSAWRLRPGRQLRRSPPWDSDCAIVFDAASGDYWVLATAAEAQLRAIESAQPDGTRSEVAGDAEMLAELQRCGLIVPVA